MADELNALQPITNGKPIANGNEFPKVGTRGLSPGESILNPDGSRSSERTISVAFDDGIHLLPTIVIDDEGFLVKVSNEDAVMLFRQGRNPSVGVFKTEAEATEFAGKRSASGGRASKLINTLEPQIKLPAGNL